MGVSASTVVDVAGSLMLATDTAENFGKHLGFTETGIAADSIASRAHAQQGDLKSDDTISQLMSKTMSSKGDTDVEGPGLLFAFAGSMLDLIEDKNPQK